jgi:Ca-activated chloride channel homolog
MPIALSSWIDRTSLRPDKPDGCSVALELTASGVAAEGKRVAARTVLALDVSLSMKGEPLDQVVRSVDRLLDALSPEDEIGVVAFAANATRVVDPVKVDAAGKRLVRSRVGRLFVESSTNIEAGLDLAAAMHRTTPPEMRRGVVLLSDGAPNVGAHTADLLREVVRRHRPGVSFFSLGYGDDHAEEILAAIGDAGGGGYEFIQDPAVCARSFARAIGAQGDVVASGIELSIMLGEGVELVRFVGREETRVGRTGVTVSLADMVNGARRLVVAELKVDPPSRERFAQELLRATARWRAPSGPNVLSVDTDATIEIADREPGVLAEGARQVLLARADEVRETARRLADRGQFAGAAIGIRKLMAEVDRLPGWVANDGTPLAEAYELLLDEAMAFERRPSAEAYAAFKKATVGSRLAAPVPSQAKSRGDASQKLIEHVAGDCPEAWLVGGTGGARHRLLEECTIGRTSEAEIQIASAMVSRRHAEVFANAGDYWIADLGSTNPTLVNGMALARAPHKLVPGDVVRVGDVELRYEEGTKRPPVR